MKRSVKKVINQARFLEEVLSQPTEKGTKQVKMTKELKREIIRKMQDSGKLIII